jgi:hypothetical protein
LTEGAASFTSALHFVTFNFIFIKNCDYMRDTARTCARGSAHDAGKQQSSGSRNDAIHPSAKSKPNTFAFNKTRRRSQMKLSIITTAALFGLSMVPLAHAQVTNSLRGNIPFDFQVGNTALPAGTYVVGRLATSQAGILTLQGLGQKKTKNIMFSSAMGEPKPGRKPTLIFHRYGSTYFLSEVSPGFGQAGNVLRPSKAERAIARQMAALPKPHEMEVAVVSFQPTGQ